MANLELCHDVFHAAAAWIVVARWVVRGRRHIDRLDDAIVDDHGETLATHATEHPHWAWMGHLDAQRPRELGLVIRHHADNGALGLLVLGPRTHDRAVVDAEDNDLSDALGPQLSFLSQVSRHLLRRSSGREGSWQADQDDLPASGERLEGMSSWWEALVKIHVWDAVAHLDDHHCEML